MTIAHFIDSLDYGGAETLLVNYINAAPHHMHIVIILSEPAPLIEKLPSNVEIFNLSLPFSPIRFLKIRNEVQKICKENTVQILHSHAFWPHMISRRVSLSNLQIVNTYHSALYDEGWHNYKLLILAYLDKLLYNKRVTLISVSDYVSKVLKDRLGYSDVKVVKNFVHDHFYQIEPHNNSYQPGQSLEIVMVGGLKFEKNYPLVIEAMQLLDNSRPIEVHVYGGGSNLDSYRKLADNNSKSKVIFHGAHPQVYKLLGNYHLFMQASFSEACPLSPIEAAIAGLPVLLSDIPAHIELGIPQAIYFKSGDVEDLVDILTKIYNGTLPLPTASNRNALQQYSKENFVRSMDLLYQSLVEKNN